MMLQKKQLLQLLKQGDIFDLCKNLFPITENKPPGNSR